MSFQEKLQNILDELNSNRELSMAWEEALTSIINLVDEDIIGLDDDVHIKINPASDEDLLITIGENANNRLRTEQRNKLRGE